MNPSLNSQLRVGYARQDITPPVGTPLFGYSGGERVANRVADGLNVSVLALAGEHFSTIILSIDWCLIDEEETEKIRSLITAKTEVPGANIIVSATHTHSGPQTVESWGWGEKNHAYLDCVRETIAGTALAAVKSLQPAVADIGTTKTGTGINRREITDDGAVTFGFQEWGPVDHTLTVIRFQGETAPIAQLIHLGAHPTARGIDPAISRDWPGVMSDRVEVATGCPVIFLNGAYGDIAPRTSVGGAVGDGEPAAQEVGLRAANDAIAVWRRLKDFRPLSVGVYHEKIDLPHAPLEPLQEAEEQLAGFRSTMATMGYEACMFRYWSAVREAHSRPCIPARAFHQTLIRIGPLVIVPFAGEIFSEIALRLRKLSPFLHTLCVGSSNGSHGYYVTREARARGGYEVWVARAYGAYLLADHIDDVLVAENLRLLKAFHQKCHG